MKQNYKIRTLLISIAVFGFQFSVFNFADAAFFVFEPKQESVFVGDVLQIPVYVDSDGENVFVVQANINFSNNMLWLKSFDLAPGWISVIGENFDFIDNRRGLAIKTAGFEGGVKEKMLLGIAEFIAVGDGATKILIFSSDNALILNFNNQNLLNTDAKIDIIINRSEAAGFVPPQLFDISFSLENSIIKSASDLTARVVFENFGRVLTPVDTVFSIVGNDERVLASYQESIIVQTQEVLTKKFDNLNLPPGDYILHLNTRYNADVIDDFQQKFSIARPRYFLRLAVAGIIIFIIGIVVFLARNFIYSNILKNLRIL